MIIIICSEIRLSAKKCDKEASRNRRLRLLNRTKSSHAILRSCDRADSKRKKSENRMSHAILRHDSNHPEQVSSIHYAFLFDSCFFLVPCFSFLVSLFDFFYILLFFCYVLIDIVALFLFCFTKF
jgi:hypothetical protein